jgi:hypothetical protein
VNAFGPGTATGKVSREGDGILLETVFTVNTQPVTLRETFPLRPDGLDLAVDVILRIEHGYQGVAPPAGQTAPNVSKGTKFFRKQP